MSGMEALYGAIKAANSRELVESAVTTYITSFTDHDIAKREALFAEDAVFSDPANSPSFNGIDQIRAFWEQIKQSPTRFEPEIHQVVVCGDSALLDFTMHMHGDEGHQCLHVRDIFEFNSNGKIQTLTAFWDPHCLSGQ